MVSHLILMTSLGNRNDMLGLGYAGARNGVNFGAVMFAAPGENTHGRKVLPEEQTPHCKPSKCPSKVRFLLINCHIRKALTVHLQATTLRALALRWRSLANILHEHDKKIRMSGNKIRRIQRMLIAENTVRGGFHWAIVRLDLL